MQSTTGKESGHPTLSSPEKTSLWAWFCRGLLLCRDGQTVGDKVDYVTCLMWKVGFMQELGVSSNTETASPWAIPAPQSNSSDAVKTALTHRSATFIFSRAFEALGLAENLGASYIEADTDSGRQGAADPSLFCRGGWAPAPPGGNPPVTKPVAGFYPQWFHQQMGSFSSEAADSGCKGEKNSKAGMGAGEGTWPIPVDDLCLG